MGRTIWRILPIRLRRSRSTDPLLLDTSFCYALYAAAHRMTKSYRPLLERLGLTYPQYLVLLVLWEQDGVTVSERSAGACVWIPAR